MFRILKTERLVLRPLNTDDLNSTHEYAGNAENAKYMIYLPNDTIEDTKEFLLNAASEWKKENPSFYEFAITLNGKHIGAISLYLDDTLPEGELGWIIHKDYWRNGYITEAATAIKEFAVHDLKVTKLIAHCDSRNIGSSRIMEKIGLTLERDDGIRYNKGAAAPSKEFLYSLILN